jgi:hypothetical protein
VLVAAPAAETQIKVALRKITESQYRHTIADIFGADIKVNARFEPVQRVDRLLALGSAQQSLTSSGFEQFFAVATSIADQALSEKKRAATVACKPADPAKPDDQCARAFLEATGLRLFRRPLAEAEVAPRVKVAAAGAQQANDFYAGLKLALTSLLMAPDFLYRVELAEPQPGNAKQFRLDAYSKASRLSFLLWDSAPDADLLEAARSGAIHTDAGLKQQVARLIASPRFEEGARAFFTDMFQLEGFDNLVKDPAIYPKFNQAVSDSAKEQMLRTALDLLVHKKRDYRELFTSNETFLNRPLASVYRVPFGSDGWAPYTFPASSERSGVFSEIAFLALAAHPGASSPTRRGLKLNEVFLCQSTPDPPPEVDFSKVQDTTKGTVRGRLLDHMQTPGCVGCHKGIDPAGLTLEHFDGAGQLRTMENGARIDVTAELGTAKIDGAPGLGQYLHDHPRVPACLVRNVFSYGTGRKADGPDVDYVAAEVKAFANAGSRFPDLLARIATAPQFLRVVLPEGDRP